MHRCKGRGGIYITPSGTVATVLQYHYARYFLLFYYFTIHTYVYHYSYRIYTIFIPYLYCIYFVFIQYLFRIYTVFHYSYIFHYSYATIHFFPKIPTLGFFDVLNPIPRSVFQSETPKYLFFNYFL